jgi:hypothetical protein
VLDTIHQILTSYSVFFYVILSFGHTGNLLSITPSVIAAMLFAVSRHRSILDVQHILMGVNLVHYSLPHSFVRPLSVSWPSY